MNNYFGYHLMVDCSNCNKENIEDSNNIRKFVTELLKVTKMKKLGNIHIENLQTGNKKLYGHSFTQLIYTSSITGHFMDISGDAYIDIFSCKKFNIDNVIKCIEKYFMPVKMNKHFIIRDANI